MSVGKKDEIEMRERKEALRQLITGDDHTQSSSTSSSQTYIIILRYQQVAFLFQDIETHMRSSWFFHRNDIEARRCEC